MKNTTIVLYPSPGIGHLVSMVELGKLILSRQPSFSIIIFISIAPYNTGSTGPYINHVSSTIPSIAFHHLPTISLPLTSSPLIEELAFEVPRLNNHNVQQALQTLSQQSSLKAFIIDFFCNAAFDVSSSLGIPTYYFYTSGASSLCGFLYLPTLHEAIAENLKDFNSYIHIPGEPPIHSSDMPKSLSYRNSMLYKQFIYTASQMAKASGILVNAVEALEPRAVKALNEGLCTPNGTTPPVYCVGPLIASSDQQGIGSGGVNVDHDEHECLNWLSSQPSKSVVFLCFGSLGTFQADQLKEIAIGLEKSGLRFLWVVKSPPRDDDSPPPEPDLDALLPKGFLEKTKDRGHVVKSWAPQVAVLNHDAVGGFVTHCGWNSALEAICAGVPMAAWPLYAEQRLNRVFLVEEMKVASPLAESKDGFVTADDLEKRVKELMDPVDGKAVRDQVMVMKDIAKAALKEGGSSYVALTSLLALWK